MIFVFPVFSLSLHRHLFVCILFSSHVIYYNKHLHIIYLQIELVWGFVTDTYVYMCNPSDLFCAIPDTSAPLPVSKRPYRPWPTSTGPPVNAHGIHHQPNIKLEVNWNSPRRIPPLLQRYIKCTIRTTPPFSSVIKGPTVTRPPLGVIGTWCVFIFKIHRFHCAS